MIIRPACLPSLNGRTQAPPYIRPKAAPPVILLGEEPPRPYIKRLARLRVGFWALYGISTGSRRIREIAWWALSASAG
jgi:hypothetical protein